MTSESEPIRKNNQTPNASGKSDTQAPQGNKDILRTSGVSSSPPSKTHCEITCKTEKNFWDHVKTGAEIIGIILLGVYTAYTIKMYCANKKAADAAESAADTAARQLDLSTRPWVGLKGKINFQYVVLSHFPSSPARLDAQMSYTLENTGNSPALKVWQEILPLVTVNDEVPTQWRALSCKNAEKVTTENPQFGAFFIMPKGVTDLPRPLHTSAPIAPEIKQIRVFWVVGCITYKDTIDKLHHTKFLYIVRLAKPIDLAEVSTTPIPIPASAVIQLGDSDAD